MSVSIDPAARTLGTRITLYDVLTYSDASWQPSSSAAAIGLSTAQVE